MQTRRQTLLLAPLLALSPALAACGSGAPAAHLTLKLAGGPGQNPSQSGAAQPVAIRLIQLAATGKFARADVAALVNKETFTLGDDDLGSEEIVLAPGATRTLARDLQPGAQFLGVAALFRDIDHAQWRAFAPVAASGPTVLTLMTSRQTVTLTAG
jgi:type VI secretion system protein VasD